MTVTRALPTLTVGSEDDVLVPSNMHGGDSYPPQEPARVPPVTTAATGTGSNDDLRSLQRFLEQTGVITAGETFSSAAELSAYTRGRMSRG